MTVPPALAKAWGKVCIVRGRELDRYLPHLLSGAVELVGTPASTEAHG